MKSFSYKNNIAGFNVSVGFKDSSFGNYEIPNGAVIHMEEEHHDEDHDDEDHEEEHHEDEETGFLANSDAAKTAQKIGISKTGDWGYFGIGFRDQESVFGLPYHVEPEGAHGHDDHDDEHGDEDDHDEHGHAHHDHLHHHVHHHDRHVHVLLQVQRDMEDQKHFLDL